MKYSKLVSLACCVLMMCAAAICVNKSLGGHAYAAPAVEAVPVSTDTITRLPDGSAVIHTAYLTKADGFAGPVPLDIHVSAQGVITSIEPLPNAETPKFFRRASTLFDAWVGKNVKDVNASEIDGISGATYSSNAIKANVDAGVNYYLKQSAPVKKNANLPLKMWVALAVTLAACVIPLFVKSKAYLTVQLVANVVVLGFWCGQFLDYAVMLKYLSHGISLPLGLTAIAMLIAAFVYPLFGHPQHYCSHVCPFGSAQILLGKISKYKIKLGVKLIKGLDWFRRLLWAALMLLLWCDVLTDWMDLELFQAFMFESAPVGIIVAASLFLLLSIVVSRPYCRFVCPTGSLIKCAENIG